MANTLVFNARKVAGFSLPGSEGTWESRLLLDPDNVGTDALTMTRFTLQPGETLDASDGHPEPHHEVYYVLSGAGVVYLGDPPQPFDMVPDTVVFIPAGTRHQVDNPGAEPLVFLTIMPGPIVEGVNPVYDGRRRAWGTAWKLAE